MAPGVAVVFPQFLLIWWWISHSYSHAYLLSLAITDGCPYGIDRALSGLCLWCSTENTDANLVQQCFTFSQHFFQNTFFRTIAFKTSVFQHHYHSRTLYNTNGGYSMQYNKKRSNPLSTSLIRILAAALCLIVTEGVALAGTYDTKTWRDPSQVSSDNAWASPDAQLAVNEHGDGIAVWQEYNLDDGENGIWVAQFSKHQGWGQPMRIDKTTVGQVGNPPSVAINEHGDAIVAWPVYNFTSSPLSTVWSSYYDHNHGWDEPVTIQDDAADAYSPLVVIDKQGNAIAIWNQTNPDYDRTNIYSNYFEKGKGWTHSKIIQSDNSVLSIANSLTINEEGTAVAMWSQYDLSEGNPQTGLVTRYFRKSKGWQPSEFVTHEDAGSPSIALNEKGDSMAAWTVLNPETRQYNVRASLHQARGKWGESQAIQSDPYVNSGSTQIALDNKDNALLIWLGEEYSYFGSNTIDVYSNHYTKGSGWSTDEMVDEAAAYTKPQLAMDEHDNAIALWEKTSAGPNPYVSYHDVYAYHYSPQYGWDSNQVIEDYDADSVYPKVAMSENGDALAIWQQTDNNLVGPTLWSNQLTSP
jgi:hypothetical protein